MSQVSDSSNLPLADLCLLIFLDLSSSFLNCHLPGEWEHWHWQWQRWQHWECSGSCWNRGISSNACWCWSWRRAINSSCSWGRACWSSWRRGSTTKFACGTWWTPSSTFTVAPSWLHQPVEWHHLQSLPCHLWPDQVRSRTRSPRLTDLVFKSKVAGRQLAHQGPILYKTQHQHCGRVWRFFSCLDCRLEPLSWYKACWPWGMSASVYVYALWPYALVISD